MPNWGSEWSHGYFWGTIVTTVAWIIVPLAFAFLRGVVKGVKRVNARDRASSRPT